MSLSPFAALLVEEALQALAADVEPVVASIKAHFPSLKDDAGFTSAVQELGYAPSIDQLNNVHGLLVEKGQEAAKLAVLVLSHAAAALVGKLAPAAPVAPVA